MIRITKEQRDAFGALRRDRYIAALAAHIDDARPALPAAPDHQKRLDEVRDLVTLAERLDLETELEIASFVELFTLFGLDLGDVRVRAIFDDQGTSAVDKVNQLEELAYPPAPQEEPT